MWSETKPMGTITAALAPSLASSSRWSLTSGSSHGTCGGPDREQNTSREGCLRATSWRTRSATTVAADRCWPRYARPQGPLRSFMSTGIEWVTNTRWAPLRTSSGRSARAARVASTTGSMNRGWLK